MRTAGDIERTAGQALIHRQHKAKTVDSALVAQGQLQSLAQRQAGIFHGVVIVNVEIAFNADLHAEAAVGGDLIQHMIEEAHTGGDLAAAFAIQPDLDVDLRLFSIALHMGVAVTFGQLFANHRPVQGLTLIAQASDAHVGRQLNVRRAIANHIAVGFIQRRVGQILRYQLHFRLAAITVVGRQVRANQDLIKDHALRGKDLHHQIVRAVEISLREAIRAEAVLIGDHHQLITGFLQLKQHRNDIGFKSQLVETIDLIVTGWFRNDSAVTIDKEVLLAHTFSAFRASITRWLSSRVPTVMRKQPLKEGCLFWSRKIMP